MKFFFKLLKWFIMGGQQIGVEIGGFGQNARRAFINSFLVSIAITGYISYKYPPQFKGENLNLYFKAILHNAINKAKCSFSSSYCSHYPIIQTNNGRQVYVRDVLSSRYIHRDLNNIKNHGYKILTYLLGLIGGIFAISSISFIILGKGKDAGDSNNNFIVHTANQVNKYLKKKKKLGYLQIGGMYLPKGSETTHMLALGSTGTGKTNLIHTFGSQIRNHTQSAIVIDPTGEMIDKHYKKGDIIFNIGDKRTFSWDLNAEFNTPGTLGTFCTAVCSWGREKHTASFWGESAHIVLEAIIKHVMSQPDPTLSKVYDFLRTSDRERLLDILKDTGARHLLEEKSPETSHNIIINLTTCINWLKHIDFTKPDTFSINAFCYEADQNPTGKWLFVSFPQDTRHIFKTLSSVILSLFISAIKNLKPNLDRRIYLTMDELASFGNLKEIGTASAELRKYGGCILAATQGIDQLIDIYGPSSTKTILNQFRTKFFFAGMMEQKLLDSAFGFTEIERMQESFSYGTHEMRDGISISKSKVSKSLVMSSDVYNLETLECYVALTEPKVRCAKIQVPLFK